VVATFPLSQLPTPSASSTAPMAVPLWKAVLLCGMAGGMGWGIRGQYGHESGAMMAGLLVSSVIAMLFLQGTSGAGSLRAIAWCTVAIGFGGSETYGQTIGLTQNAHLIGNNAAWWWGMLGLAVKGGVWIGFAGCFLGMGLSGIRYSRRELAGLMTLLPLVYLIGIWWLNSPFNPGLKRLPSIYFSETWDWRPNGDVKPRFECWGGLLAALGALLIYARLVRRDRLALRLGLAGILGGALGFPGGQTLQSFHAWHLESFRSGWIAHLDPHLNWWNLMEITFGAIMGCMLGLFVWLNRQHIRILPNSETTQSPVVDVVFLMVHLLLLTVSEFSNVAIVNALYGLGICMGWIPIVTSANSRLWPSFLVTVVLMLPIAGKTVRELIYRESAIAPLVGWVIYFLLPLVVAAGFCWKLVRECDGQADGHKVGRLVLLWGAWSFFLLNFAFFRFPWPWQNWTTRTPSAVLYSICLWGLTAAALNSHKRNTTAVLPLKNR
jgi:hypothetical protein